MFQNNQNSEEEDESLIEVSMSEFKIKEHKLEKARWPHKAEMLVQSLYWISVRIVNY